MKTFYLIIAHGSREKKSNDAFWGLVARLQKTFPKKQIAGAFLEIAKPNIPDAIQTCVREGAGQIIVVPLMVFPGKHVKDHIPNLFQEARKKYPDLDFHIAAPLTEHPDFLKLLSKALHAHD